MDMFVATESIYIYNITIMIFVLREKIGRQGWKLMLKSSEFMEEVD